MPDKQPLLGEFTAATREQWHKAAEALLKGAPFDKVLKTRTYDGYSLKPIYDLQDLEQVPFAGNLPGFAPYVRGTSAGGYVANPWLVAQETGQWQPEKFNQVLLDELMRGQTAVNVTVDDATLAGQDPDILTDAEKCGLSLASLNDLRIALQKVSLEHIDIFIHAFTSALPVAAMLAALAKEQGLDATKIKGAIGADPLSQLTCQGKINCSMQQAYDEMCTLTSWAIKNMPALATIAVHGYPWQYAGGTPVQELAFVMATCAQYIDAMLERGLTIEEITPRMHLNFAVGPDFFAEIAKLRAARLLFANLAAAYGASEEYQKIRIHSRTGKFNKTVHDPYNNMLRVTTEAFAAVMGGTDSLHTGAFDEIMRHTDEFSRRIARNVQLILAEECHFERVIDPAGGSWYIESLTKTMAEESWKVLQQVDEQGGFFQTLQNGFIQNHVQDVFEARNKDIRTRKNQLIGTNMYANPGEPTLEGRDHTEADIATRQQQVAATRKQMQVKADTFADLVEAFAAGATLGQVCDALRQGQVTTVSKVTLRRAAVEFELLRSRTAKAAAAGKKPQAFLANMGPVGQHKARADFSRGFFETAGFEVVDNGFYGTPQDAANAALSSGCQVVVVCSTDTTYPELVPPLVASIKQQKPNTIMVLAGYPKDQLEAHKQAGIDEFIYVKADAVDLLARTLNSLGVE